MLKINSATIEIISDKIVDLIRQGKLLKRTAEGDSGWQGKLTDDEKTRIRRRSQRLSRPIELDFRKGLAILFKEQRDLVIDVLSGKKSMKGLEEDAKKAAKVPLSKAEAKKFAKQTLPKITAAVMLSGDKTLTELEVGIAFDVLNPEVVSWIKKEGAELVKDILTTTKNSLKATLTEGIKGGESIVGLTKRIKEVYKSLELEGWRAKRIAMTETKNCVSQGNLSGYRQSGIKGKKGILLGPNPCDICIDLAGIGLIGLDDTWDGFDAPSFHPNCHCDIYFVPG